MAQLTSKSLSPTCPICHYDFDIYYRTPRVVPKCGHTFCQKCINSKLTTRANRKVFICPDCSSQIVIRKGVAQDVPKNIGIIDIVKNLKKYASNEKQQQRWSLAQTCADHQRPYQLVCETCKYKKICSHCALFGQHKTHHYSKEKPASKLDLKQVKQTFDLISESIKIALLPQSETNIKASMKKKLSQGLRKCVTNSFKQYYDILEKKQFQILQQCDNIEISQGGIDNNIDKIIKQYDSLKNTYEFDWRYSIENNGVGRGNRPISVNTIEDYMNRCKDLHCSVENIQKYAFQHIQKIIKDISTKVMQTTMFKIQQMSFSLKKIVEGINNPQQLLSPSKRVKIKSTTPQIKSRSVIGKQQNKINNDNNKVQSKQLISNKKKDSYSQIQKLQSRNEDFSILEAGKFDLHFFNQAAQNNKNLKEIVSNNMAYNGQRGSLPPKSKVKVTLSQYETKINGKPIKHQDKSKYVSKQLSPAKSTNVFMNKTGKSAIVPNTSPQLQDLKFVRPTKEISFHFLSKFQEIIVEADRQSQSSTLQLVSLDINDTLILYSLDYLRIKKYHFQIIKFVKNQITDQGFKTLLSFLANDNTTQLLNLTSNQLTFKSIELILLFSTKNNILRTFYLSNNKISSFQLKSRKNQIEKYQLQITV